MLPRSALCWYCFKLCPLPPWFRARDAGAPDPPPRSWGRHYSEPTPPLRSEVYLEDLGGGTCTPLRV